MNDSRRVMLEFALTMRSVDNRIHTLALLWTRNKESKSMYDALFKIITSIPELKDLINNVKIRLSSDRCASIREPMLTALPNAQHPRDDHHIAVNIQSHTNANGKLKIKGFYDTVHALTPVKKDIALNKWKVDDPLGSAYLESCSDLLPKDIFLSDSLTHYGVATGGTNSSNYVEVNFATQTRLKLRHGALLSNVLGQMSYCQECWNTERKEIQTQIDGQIVLVRVVAQLFKEYDETIKKYTIKATNIVGENAQFMVSYEGLPANNRPVDLSNKKCGCMVWEHTEVACHHIYKSLKFILSNHPTHPLALRLDSNEKQWAYLVADRFIAKNAILGYPEENIIQFPTISDLQPDNVIAPLRTIIGPGNKRNIRMKPGEGTGKGGIKSKGASQRSRSKFEVGNKGGVVSEKGESAISEEIAESRVEFYPLQENSIDDNGSVIMSSENVQILEVFEAEDIPHSQEVEKVNDFNADYKSNCNNSSSDMSGDMSGESTPSIFDDTPLETETELIPYDPNSCVQPAEFKLFGEEEIAKLMSSIESSKGRDGSQRVNHAGNQGSANYVPLQHSYFQSSASCPTIAEGDDQAINSFASLPKSSSAV